MATSPGRDRATSEPVANPAGPDDPAATARFQDLNGVMWIHLAAHGFAFLEVELDPAVQDD